MVANVELLTAETARGREAIAEVMRQSYTADVDAVPPEWALARVVDGLPVSFILVDPAKAMEFPGGDVRYAFINDVATRKDCRGQGHFRAITEAAFACLRQASITAVATHGRYPLYRRFGFEVFTHHCGIFLTPAQIERRLGTEAPEGGEKLLEVCGSRHVQQDLLLVEDVQARTLGECRAALLAAAALARQLGKERILFEHPAAPSYGSRYPMHLTVDTPLAELARACGGNVCLQGADPESGPIPDADWLKVLDAPALLAEVLHCQPPGRPLVGAVSFDTDAGRATIESASGAIVVREGIRPDTPVVYWPATALAQLVTGYQSAAALDVIHGSALPEETLTLLDVLFPRRWRFSRNESWTYST